MPVLTRRQQRFVDEYLTDLSGAAAARRMGVSYATAPSAASRLLRRPQVRAAVEHELARQRAGARIDVAGVLGELARVAFFDPGRLVDAAGQPIAINALDADTRAGLGQVEITETEATDDAPARRTLRPRAGQKVRALAVLARYLHLQEAERQRLAYAEALKATQSASYSWGTGR